MWRLIRAVSTLLVLALCLVAASKLDLKAAGHAALKASPGWLALAGLLNFPFALLQAWRWRFLLRTIGSVPLLSLFRYLLASRAASNLLPARAGELLRIYLPSARDGCSAVAVGSGLVIEHLFDALGLAAVATPLIFFWPAPHWVRTGVLLLVGGGVAGLAVTVVLAIRGGRARRGIIDRIAQSAECLRRPGILFPVLAITLLCWLTEVVILMCCLAAVGLPANAGLATMTLLAVNLGMVLQLTPANVGVFEASVIVGLAAHGLVGPQPQAMALLYHLVMWLPTTLAGLEGIRFVGAARRSQADAPPAPPASDEERLTARE